MQGPRVLLLLCVLALVLIGLVMVFSASVVKALENGAPAETFFRSQVIFAVLGAIIAFVLWKVIPYRFWMGSAVWLVWAVALALILAVWLVGVDHYGAKRWLSVGGSEMQPSEFCKIAFLLVAARLLVDYRSGTVELKTTLLRAFVLIIVPIAIMYRTQSDLGTTAICFVGILAVMWMGGVSKRVLAACLVVAVAGAVMAVFGTGYRADRMVFLDPWNDGEGGYGKGYNIIRSFYALSEGGIFGVGLGNSHEKFQYLFASESDFIFAIIGEELGLVGALVVIALFFGVLFAGLSIAERASDDVGAMIAGGCTVMLVFQAFLNIACVIGVFPTTGKPLPFISSGGTSMLASFILVGLILSVSAADREPSVYEQRRADLRLVKQERGGADRGRGGAADRGRPSRSRSRSGGRSGGAAGSRSPRGGSSRRAEGLRAAPFRPAVLRPSAARSFRR
ncbi:putative peptidoglycan glycosyltransferase FtsW [Adlercreutzia sp. R21]|uniref:Probable peptidoglycan glycosyltransferase FtsW n=1 Tax=Adlercreutzia wanghongyangiae TaxID=3111451 RepID=A0ABU6IJ08_9ACTN|nr:putative peptidoglycan glycosyltransferase FtsW [Adlercreutzia sp. R21]MEC4176405.1 putative peptidoglycan glycosyltransferase FtsW [Adlercreutzia sp. R7]MEC4184621.1 putative peptidoglycan glycosyltransferase FtsW [Adlercreutzia sp. R21]